MQVWYIRSLFVHEAWLISIICFQWFKTKLINNNSYVHCTDKNKFGKKSGICKFTQRSNISERLIISCGTSWKHTCVKNGCCGSYWRVYKYLCKSEQWSISWVFKLGERKYKRWDYPSLWKHLTLIGYWLH